MAQVDIQQAGERLSELIELAVAGEEVIIFKDERPLARLEAYSTLRGRRSFGSAKGMIKMREDFDDPLDGFEEYR